MMLHLHRDIYTISKFYFGPQMVLTKMQESLEVYNAESCFPSWMESADNSK
jgi:hypothetical protein